MGFLSTFKKIVDILDFFTKKWDGVKEYVRRKYQKFKAKRVRKAVDCNNAKYISKRVRRIVKARQDRQDTH